jgi:hypothetical protein
MAHAAALKLQWDRNPESNVDRYRLSFGTAPGVRPTIVDCGNNTICLIPNLVQGRRYYIAVQAGTNTGLWSSPSVEVSGIAELETTPAAANILLGQGPFANVGGFFAVHGGADRSFAQNAFARIPWPVYNATGGSVRMATGDVDGDGLDEVVVGLGARSNGWVAVLDDAAHYYDLLDWIQVDWPTYNAGNGEVYPAVGNIDGDARAEIVLGLGDGGRGWYQVFDDAATGYNDLGWKRVTWPAYNGGPGATHPAIADVDGNGVSEIVLGLGNGSAGWLEVVNGAPSSFSHRAWIQVHWPAYNASRGMTYPAAGDLDNDGRAEIVVGLGPGSEGYFEVFEDAAQSFRHVRWDKISWPSYNTHTGESHPAVGNIDADNSDEIVFGLGQYPGNGGWFEVRDDTASGYRHLSWTNINWTPFKTAGGALYPAIAGR